MGRSARAANNNSSSSNANRLTSYYAYVRTWNILSHLFPSSSNNNNKNESNKRIKHVLLSTLPLQRLLQLFHPPDSSAKINNHNHPPKSIISLNLWIGDGDVVTPIHYDGMDNILLQLVGTKTLLLLPPSCKNDLGYERRMEEEWTYDVSADTTGEEEITVAEGGGTSSTPPPISWSRTKTERYVENHGSFNPFTQNNSTGTGPVGSSGSTVITDERGKPKSLKRMVRQWVDQGARLVTLQPGQGLFLPEFWSHAVVSTVRDEKGTDNDGNRKYNHIINNQHTHATTTSHRHGNDHEHAINLAINLWFKRP